jgi:hypothetical protein
MVEGGGMELSRGGVSADHSPQACLFKFGLEVRV